MQTAITRIEAIEREARRPGLDQSGSLVALQFLIARHFSEEEIRQLCFEMDIATGKLDGVGPDGKARELVLYCQRRGLLDTLYLTCRQKRPHAPWDYAASLKD